MAVTRSFSAALLASAIIFTCAEAFFLRPLPIPDPLGLLSKIAPIPKKRSVYIHSIKNNFYPVSGDSEGDSDGDYSPGYSKPDYTKPDYSKPDYSQPEYPKPDYPKPDYTKPDNPKPDHTKPDYTKPNDPKPDYPKLYSKPDNSHPIYPKPSDPKPVETPSNSQPDPSLIVKDILQQDVKPGPYYRPPGQETTTAATYRLRKNHYNRLHAHSEEPLRRQYSQGRKNEIYEEENHRPVVYPTPAKHQRRNRDSDPEVIEVKGPSTTSTTPVPPEALNLDDLINNVFAYLDIISDPRIPPNEAIKETMNTIIKELMDMMKENMALSTCTTPKPTTTTTTAQPLTPMDKAMAALQAALNEARNKLKSLAFLSVTENPATGLDMNTVPIPDPKQFEDFEIMSTPPPESPDWYEYEDVTDAPQTTLSPMDQALAGLQAALAEAKYKLQPEAPPLVTEASPPATPSQTGDKGSLNIPLLPTNIEVLMQELSKLTPENAEQTSPPAISETTTPEPYVLNGIIIGKHPKRLLRQNYIEEQEQEAEEEHEEHEEHEEPEDIPRPSYAIAPRKTQAVRRYERPQTCPRPVEVPPPRYRPRVQQARPRPQERHPVREQPRQVQTHQREQVYRRPAPVRYPVYNEEEREEYEQDDGYHKRVYKYPENEEQCRVENRIRY